MWTKIGLYWHTIRHLRLTQIKYRVWYLLRKKWRERTRHSVAYTPQPVHVSSLSLVPSISHPTAYEQNGQESTFTFLQQTHTFAGSIDWNFAGYGKLWTYNLNYFEYLHQQDGTVEDGLWLMRDFVDQFSGSLDGKEPFPTSLRIINWIKFLVIHQLADEWLEHHLQLQLARLRDHLEYHLLGNHLLENAFALLFGAIYTQDKAHFAEAEQLLLAELNEQILTDGGHFERSPMYHHLMLYRLLDSINFLAPVADQLGAHTCLAQLRAKAGRMLRWMVQMTLPDGRMPLLNDSAPGIAPTSDQLLAYGARLGITPAQQPLGDSGYRLLTQGNWWVLADAGDVGPDYIPGHAHSDTLSCVLYHNNHPILIDPGISTYEKNERRQWERSTAAHNTVQIAEQDQTEVWGGFRVARRAYATIIKDDPKELMAEHNGYRHLGLKHVRHWKVGAEGVVVVDEIQGRLDHPCVAYFHLPYNLPARKRSDATVVTKDVVFDFSAPQHIDIATYQLPQGYNRLVEAQRIAVTFRGRLETKIYT